MMKKNRNEELDSPKQISKPNRIKLELKSKRPVKKEKTRTLVEEIDDEFMDHDEFDLYEENEDYI